MLYTLTCLYACVCLSIPGTLVQHEKAATFLHILKSFFVRHSSEYETSDSDRQVIQNLYSQMWFTWLGESKWPQEWPISPITIIYLKIASEKMKSFCLHKTGFESKQYYISRLKTQSSVNRKISSFRLQSSSK